MRIIRVAGFALILSLVGGAVGDVLRPVGVFNFYALLGAAGLALLLLVFSLKWVRVALVCFFFVCLAAGLGGWWALAEFRCATNQGFLAEHLRFVEKLQGPVITAFGGPDRDAQELKVTLAAKFSEVEIQKPFDMYLLANPLLMETTGAKIIRLDNGRDVILVVASTALNDQSPEERLRAEKVCRMQALQSMVAETEGVEVAHVEQQKDRRKLIVNGKRKSRKSVSEVLHVTKTKVQGLAKAMPVVGKWKSKEGDVLYLAVGMIRDEPGLKALVKRLGSPDAGERLKTVQALGAMGPAAQPALGHLIPILKDSDPTVRREAAAALERLGRPAKADVAALVAALGDDGPEVRL